MTPRLVRWCQRQIPNVSFTENGLEPPLPYKDDSFDFVYSASVYTHLPVKLQKQWLREQLRVVGAGGLLLLTVHGDAYRHRLTASEGAEYDSVGFVEHGGVGRGGPWFTTYNSPRYMEEDLLAGLEIVYRETVGAEMAGLSQDRWVVRKTPDDLVNP
jgi:SAM-dependent methyltransferase